MSKKLILAEKADEAEKYALAFKNHKKINEVWEVSDPDFGTARITHAQGHLTELDEPEAYQESWKEWHMKDLPIIPSKFHMHISNGRNQKKLFNIIKEEVEKADEVIIGTDADREGENIAYSILGMIPNGRSKVTKRIWQNSTTKKGVQKALLHLKNATETQPFANEARARQKSDWLIGMNMSRLATLKLRESGYYIKGGFPVGRVQTAIISLLVENDRKIKSFKKSNFWKLELVDSDGIHYKSDKKFDSEVEGQKALKVLQENSIVKQFETKQKEQAAPKLLNLFDVSAIAKNRWGYTSDKTLDVIQHLYDRGSDKEGWLSYPRTKGKYITDDEFEYLTAKVAKYQQILGTHFDIVHKEKRQQYVDNDKVKEHTALIPTEVIPNSLQEMEEDQQRIYQLITLRTILMFAENEKYNETSIKLKNEGYEFKAELKNITNEGFKAVLNKFENRQKSENEREDSETTEVTGLPPYTVGQSIFTKPRLIKGETKPPKRISEAMLVKSILPKYQIGTAATVAGILKTLKDHNYVKDQKDGFYPTDKGYAITEFLYGTPFVDPETTSGWEKYLHLIGTDHEGRYTEETFVKKTENMITALVKNISQQPQITLSTLEKGKQVYERSVNSKMGVCPVCKVGTIEEVSGVGKNGSYHIYTCSNKDCKFYIPDRWGSKSLNKNEVEQIILDKKTQPFEFTSKGNKKYTGYLIIEKSKLKMEFIKK